MPWVLIWLWEAGTLTVAIAVLKYMGVRWGAVRVTGRLAETRAAVRG
jgi:hypothetical protein